MEEYYMMAIIIGLPLFVILIYINRKINKLENSLRHINSKLDKITVQNEVYKIKIDDDELKMLVREGKRFEAVNNIMNTMGFSVKESHEYIDELIKKRSF